jgi:predicted SnoaL-like aldol condensation-catalyzing enzyme
MSASQPISALDHNKQLTIRWFEDVWNQSRRDVIFELFAPECILHEGSTPIRGPQEFAAFFDRLQSQFDNIHITPAIALAENDLVSLRWSVNAVHKATGKETAVSGISIVRIKDGRFVEAWQNWDAAGMAAQLSETSAAQLF